MLDCPRQEQRLIGGLEKGDFHLLKTGRSRRSNTSPGNGPPANHRPAGGRQREPGRLIDTERRAASAFFRSVLRPKDLAFLISFGKDSELLQDSTSSAKL